MRAACFESFSSLPAKPVGMFRFKEGDCSEIPLKIMTELKKQHGKFLQIKSLIVLAVVRRSV